MLSVRTQKRIANRITLFIVALELISITTWGMVTYGSSRAEILKSISNQLHEAALRTKAEVDRFFDPIKLQVRALAEIFYSIDVLEEKREKLLYQLLKIRPEIDEISIVARSGEELLRVSRMRAYGKADMRILKHNPLVIKALEGIEAIGEITFSKYFEPMTYMAVPLGVKGSIEYVLVCRINLKWLWTLVKHQTIGQTGYVYIVDANRSLLAYKDPSLVRAGTNVADMDIPEALFDPSGEIRLHAYRNFNGEDVTGTAVYEPVNRWWLVVEQPTKEGLAPLNRMIRKYVLIFLGAAIVTVVLVWFFTRMTLRPLEDFVRSMARIASGERKVRFNTPKDSELEFLAIGFNAMSQSLDARIHELEESHRELRESKEQYRLLSESLQQRVDQATEALRKANAELHQAAVIAQASSDSKSSFLANMSHELRTPLNAILGYSEMLLDEMEGIGIPQCADDARRIIHAGNHLLALINDILDLSKVEAGRLRIELEEVDVRAVVSDIVGTVEPLAAKNNNRFNIKCVDEETKIIADEMRLRQIIINLLSNAFKFTENGLVELAVKRVTMEQVNYVEFVVTDNGIGLSPEQMERIFEPFSQADASTTRRFGGTGLGLAISKKFCELMNATIEVSSKEHQGSTFTVRFRDCMANDEAPFDAHHRNAGNVDTAMAEPG